MQAELKITGLTSCGRLGTALREARRAAGMTQTQLAAASGVSRPRISVIESGMANPGIDSVMRLLRALECSLTLETIPPGQFSLSRHLARNRPPHAAS